MNKNHANQCLIYAHRGARKEAADNTRAAFDKALNYPIDGMETDVQLTLDEVSVLWHDRFLDKLGLENKRIDDFTYAALEQINFASYFTGAKEENVLSLNEFIASYRSRCKLQIEIKNRDWELISRHEVKMRQCLELLQSASNLDVFISSFNLPCLVYAHQLKSNIPLVYALQEHHSLADLKQVIDAHYFLAGFCHPIATLSQEMVKLLREHNKFIVTYTCNSEQEIRKALNLEVNILITDFPQRAIQLRN